LLVGLVQRASKHGDYYVLVCHNSPPCSPPFPAPIIILPLSQLIEGAPGGFEDSSTGPDGEDNAVDVDALATNQTEVSLGLLKVRIKIMLTRQGSDWTALFLYSTCSGKDLILLY
jgi:hypothetical protein